MKVDLHEAAIAILVTFFTIAALPSRERFATLARLPLRRRPRAPRDARVPGSPAAGKQAERPRA